MFLRGDDVLQACDSDLDTSDGEPFGGSLKIFIPLPVPLEGDHIDEYVEIPGISCPR